MKIATFKLFIIGFLSICLVSGSSIASAASTIGANISTGGDLTVSGSSTLGTIISGLWNGTAIGTIYGGTGLTSYITGDILYSSAANTLSKLAIGAPGQVLTVAGGVPTWATASSGFTDPMTTRGDIIYRNSINTTTRLGRGTAGQVLTSDGTDISWATPSSGITSLNGLTAATQTFATGTSGTDFGISSAGSTHTFNLPTASATNRGLLSSADWTTFNAKGNGTVTSFSSGDLSPLFTTSVLNPTTTPALSFSLSNAAANTVFGNNTGSSAAPAFFSPVLASSLFANQGTTTTVLHGNASGNPSWSAVSLTADVSGNLPVTNLNSGTGATASTFWRGDGTWATPSSGITSLNGQTGASQTFANDTNVTISSVANTHTLGWTGTLSVARGGSGAATLTGLLRGNGTSAFTGVTTSAGISGAISDETGSGVLVFDTSPTFSGFVKKSLTNNITATLSASCPASAVQLTTDINIITVSTNNADCVMLPAGVTGMAISIVNEDAGQNINVYPQTGSTINGAASYIAVRQLHHHCIATSSTTWVCRE